MKYEIIEFDLIRWYERENFDLIIGEKNDYENICVIKFDNNLKIKFYYNFFRYVKQNEKFLYLYDARNFFQINPKTLEVKKFSYGFRIFEIYFWKDFLIIYGELDVLILNRDLGILKEFSMSGIIENFEISKNILKFSDENGKNFDFDLKTLS